MTDKIVFTSSPRLFILATTFFGSVFMALLTWLSWQRMQNDSKWLYIFPLLFGALSLYALMAFINIKVVRLSASGIQMAHFMVPIRQTFPLHKVRDISQRSKNIDVGYKWSDTVQIPYFVTTITFTDDRVVKLNSLGALEYQELMRCFNKLTRGTGHIVPPKKRVLRYMLDSWNGLGIVILLIILTTGLGIALFRK